MAEIIITEEDVLNANTYIPSADKEEFARNIAVLCAEPVEVRVGDADVALPNRARENRRLRHQFQMGLLATYLRKDFHYQMVKFNGGEEAPLTMCMEASECDEWASSHVFNQLERIKKGKNHEAANKVFDLLYDYKSLESMISVAIRDELDAINDPLTRIMQYLITETSTEVLKKAMYEMGAQAEAEMKEIKGE